MTRETRQPWPMRRIAIVGWSSGATLWLLWTLLTAGFVPRMRVEPLPIEEWGFGGLPRGTAYYFNPGYSCVFFYGDSVRLGSVRVITHIHEGSALAFPPRRTPPSAR